MARDFKGGDKDRDGLLVESLPSEAKSAPVSNGALSQFSRLRASPS